MTNYLIEIHIEVVAFFTCVAILLNMTSNINAVAASWFYRAYEVV